jgi:hypothetical protein
LQNLKRLTVTVRTWVILQKSSEIFASEYHLFEPALPAQSLFALPEP